MVQNAVVKDIIKEGVVRVSLMRQMECGMHCDGACAGCTQKPTEEILAEASNDIGAKPGDIVTFTVITAKGNIKTISGELIKAETISSYTTASSNNTSSTNSQFDFPFGD